MCKIAPNAADFDCPELERAVERSRRGDPIFRSGMSRPTSSNDAVVFPDAVVSRHWPAEWLTAVSRQG
jgi:hypothetical protein